MKNLFLNVTDSFLLNSLKTIVEKSENKYKFIQADCVDLLNRPEEYDLGDKFDLIFLDPPSFSNSKKMHDTLDILRDHEELIVQSMALLYKKGSLIFSTNKKGFKLSASLLKRFNITDITRQTIPEDFKRRPKIHQCWEIKH